MAEKYDIYIGSENGSRRLTADYVNEIIEWAKANLPEGYTLVRGLGYSDGSLEDSVILSFLSYSKLSYGEGHLTARLKALKERLQQKAILLSRYPVELETV